MSQLCINSYYTSRGVLTVLPMPNVNAVKGSWYHGQETAIFDCHLRNYYTANWLMFQVLCLYGCHFWPDSGPDSDSPENCYLNVKKLTFFFNCQKLSFFFQKIAIGNFLEKKWQFFFFFNVKFLAIF